MPIYCPNCATPSHIRATVGSSGRMVRCRQCGTTWLARAIDGDPYQRRQRQAIAAPTDVADAIVIEHIGAGFKTPPPPLRRRARRRSPIAANRGAFKILGAALAVVVTIIVLRIPFVAALPQLAMAGLPDEVAKLEFQRVRSETVELRGVSTLFVEGEIVNRSDRDVALPAVRISLRSADGTEVSSWLVEPATAGLAAGRSIGFRSALASPPPAATQVTLKLAAREGQTIGLR
jgi:predicted Zn finger-like uncharacterized protein